MFLLTMYHSLIEWYYLILKSFIVTKITAEIQDKKEYYYSIIRLTYIHVYNLHQDQ